VIGAWRLLVRKALLDAGRSPAAALAGECVASLMALAVYWFTSKAVGPALSFSGDYFTFVVVGESTLLIPLMLWSGIASVVRSGAADGTLELFLTLPVRAPGLLALQAAALIPRESLRVLTSWGIACALFGMAISPWRLVDILVLQLFAAPLFLGFGLIAAAFLLRLGRGYGVLAQVGTLGSVLAGAYFPLGVLPEPIRRLSVSLSPFTSLMETSRTVLASGWSASVLAVVAAWLVAGGLVLALGWLALELSFASLRRRGTPVLFVH
jgi:ABC-2 type transport system permease protein